jgi:hypothetical protein
MTNVLPKGVHTACRRFYQNVCSRRAQHRASSRCRVLSPRIVLFLDMDKNCELFLAFYVFGTRVALFCRSNRYNRLDRASYAGKYSNSGTLDKPLTAPKYLLTQLLTGLVFPGRFGCPLTVRDLALYPPYLAASRLLNETFFPENTPGYDPDRPDDLLPKIGEYPSASSTPRFSWMRSNSAPPCRPQLTATPQHSGP